MYKLFGNRSRPFLGRNIKYYKSSIKLENGLSQVIQTCIKISIMKLIFFNITVPDLSNFKFVK